MRPILEKIIDPVQSAFVPNGSIHDNILLTHEIVNKLHTMKGKEPLVAIKPDIKKAHDRVKWTFLFQALNSLGFHSKRID